MIREIDVEGVGIVRMPNMWAQERIKKMPRHNQWTGWLAFSCEMSVKQFKKLPHDRQVAVWEAFKRLSSPANV